MKRGSNGVWYATGIFGAPMAIEGEMQNDER